MSAPLDLPVKPTPGTLVSVTSERRGKGTLGYRVTAYTCSCGVVRYLTSHSIPAVGGFYCNCGAVHSFR